MTSRVPNPAGGPAAMLSDTIGRVAVVEDRVSQLGSDLSETAAMVADVQAVQADQQRQINALADQVATLPGGAPVGDDGEDETQAVDWSQLDRASAEREWARLYDWVDGWLVPTYRITIKQLPVCWPHHPAVRDELSWLRACWAAAYRIPDASPTAAAEWHTRWLPACLDRIATHVTGCTTGQHRDYSTGAPRDFPLPEEIRRAVSGSHLSLRAWWLHDGRDADLADRST